MSSSSATQKGQWLLRAGRRAVGPAATHRAVVDGGDVGLHQPRQHGARQDLVAQALGLGLHRAEGAGGWVGGETLLEWPSKCV